MRPKSHASNPSSNFPAAAKDLLRAAEKGHASAQFLLAGLYEEGKGLERSLDSAIYWLEASAKQDFVQSFFPLGMNLLARADSDIKTASALSWIERAADNNDEDAQYALSQIYLKADGVEEDIARGEKLLKAAAENGLAEAQFEYARHKIEKGSESSVAAPFMVAAAEQGFVSAFLQAAQFLRDGDGVEKELSRAAFFFKQAADNGNAHAQLETARNFDNGFGIPKDREEAVHYYQLSAAQGLIEAEMKLAEAFSW